MGNVLNDTKQQQILVLGRLGWSLRRIAAAIGVRRETASRYLKAAGVAVRRPGHQRCEQTANAASQVSTDSPAPSPPDSPSNRSRQRSTCEPFRHFIEDSVRHGRDAMSIWQDLVADHDFPGRYASVRRFVAKIRQAAGTLDEAHPVISTEPGLEAQVDYGTGPMVRHPTTGKYRRTRLFVLTLGYSRKSVWLLTWKSSSEIWAQLHEKAWRRLGGATRTVVLDNLREGVIRPDIYDPEINPVFRDMLAHYGAVAVPCRVRDPNRKGKVESGVAYGQRKIQGLRFESMEEAQAYLDRFETRWADTRIHGSTKRQVSEAFAEEKPYLLELPAEPFSYYHYAKRKVHIDGSVEVDRSYYAPPPGYVGRVLDVQWDERHVRIIDPTTGELLREHVKKGPGYRSVHPGDEPKRTPQSTLALLGRASGISKNVGELCRAIHRRHRQAGVRGIQGVLALGRKHGASRLDDACHVALEVGAHEYRFVRRYLERKAPEPVQLTLTHVDPLIRELTSYRDLIGAITDPEDDSGEQNE